MKDTIKDANFPRTADNRVYHLGLKPGEVANRLLTVGAPSRAKAIATLLDTFPIPFVHASERGFVTYTGRYKGVPVTIMAIGMGTPNLDFFVRESRETVTGDMVVVRLGSCGALLDVPPASVVVPKACVNVARNVDYDFVNDKPDETGLPAYIVSKPVRCALLMWMPNYTNWGVFSRVHDSLEAAKPPNSQTQIIGGIINASADSFYSSQGRLTSFPDRNEHIIDELKTKHDVATLEMETFHLMHLAQCFSGQHHPPTTATSSPPKYTPDPDSPFVIRAAAAQMVFAARESKDFITPAQVGELEEWTGRGVLNALVKVDIEVERLHPEAGSAWEVKV